jgi:hypothetical protein
MRKIIPLLALAIAAIGSQAHAQRSGLGAGVIVGEPTGFSIKGWLNETTAIDGALAWSFEGNSSFHAHATYLWHNFSLFPVDRGALPGYFGVGARYRSMDRGSDRLGIRVPFGLAYHFDNLPLEAFGEIAPILDFSPKTDLQLNAAIGLRYYFR